MKPPPSLVRQLIDDRLRQGGFRRKGSVFVREQELVVHVAGIQRSRYMPQYWLNLGILYKQINSGTIPKRVERCHLYLRAGQIDHRITLFSKALDEESEMTVEERAELIDVLVGQAAEDVLRKYSDIDDAIELVRTPYEDKQPGSPWASVELGQYAGVPPTKAPYMD